MIKLSPQALLEVDLNNIADNYRFIKNRLKAGTVCAAVVKADSYGLGSVKVAKKLYDECGCRNFYTAYFSEAQKLDAIEESEIFVLHGFAGVSPDDFVGTNIVPVLNSMEDIELWKECSKRHGKKLPASIHIDTGMNRLGIDIEKDIPIIANSDLEKFVDIKYLMSHLACAEEKNNPKNPEQLEKFNYAVKALGIKSRLSFANSSGVFLGEGYHFDQVRPGAALYGINPETDEQNKMKPVISLKAKILQLRDVKNGETVGYGASYRVSKSSKLATIAVGYADGLLRSFAVNDGYFYINKKKTPLVGRVSMDAVVIDITDIEVEVKVGDWVDIIGEHQTVDNFAVSAGTIGYEVLTALGSRYKRVYKG